jgi:hypothetical protein
MGDGTGPLVFGDTVTRDLIIRSNTTTGGSMLSDEDVLSLVLPAWRGLLRCGSACGFGAEACVISSELQGAAKSGVSKSVRAYEVCRLALEVYSRESGLGKLFYIVNSRLRRVRSIALAIGDMREECLVAVTK